MFCSKQSWQLWCVDVKQLQEQLRCHCSCPQLGFSVYMVEWGFISDSMLVHGWKSLAGSVWYLCEARMSGVGLICRVLFDRAKLIISSQRFRCSLGSCSSQNSQFILCTAATALWLCLILKLLWSNFKTLPAALNHLIVITECLMNDSFWGAKLSIHIAFIVVTVMHSDIYVQIQCGKKIWKENLNSWNERRWGAKTDLHLFWCVSSWCRCVDLCF